MSISPKNIKEATDLIPTKIIFENGTQKEIPAIVRHAMAEEILNCVENGHVGWFEKAGPFGGWLLGE